MKLKNKKTGEIIDIYKGEVTLHYNQGKKTMHFKCLEDLEEWEDVPEEPKGYYFIRDDGSGVGYSPIANSTVAKRRESIGNYFSTKEEAELAVRKLKAWKRLKDKGFRIRRNNYNDGMMYLHIWNDATDEPTPIDKNSETFKDLDLLFCPEVKNDRY